MSDEKVKRADFRALASALRQKWDVPPDHVRRVLAAAMATLDDPDATNRERTAAGALILTAGKSELEALKFEASLSDDAAPEGGVRVVIEHADTPSQTDTEAK